MLRDEGVCRSEPSKRTAPATERNQPNNGTRRWDSGEVVVSRDYYTPRYTLNEWLCVCSGEVAADDDTAVNERVNNSYPPRALVSPCTSRE